MKRLSFPLAIAVCAFPAVTWAASPSYNYVEAGYLDVDIDNLDDTGDGHFLGASLGARSWHLFGEYAEFDTDANFEQTGWALGVGWHGLLGSRADLVAEASYIDLDLEGPMLSTGDDGWGVRGGVRFLPIKLLEVGGFVHYVDLSTAGSDESYELNAILNVWRIGIGAAVETADDVDEWNVFVRLNFGLGR